MNNNIHTRDVTYFVWKRSEPDNVWTVLASSAMQARKREAVRLGISILDVQAALRSI